MAQKLTEATLKKNRERTREWAKTEAGKASQAKYAEKIRRVLITINEEKDQDILAALDEHKPIAGQLKDLIREAITIRKVMGK